jgi:signal peptidase I
LRHSSPIAGSKSLQKQRFAAYLLRLAVVTLLAGCRPAAFEVVMQDSSMEPTYTAHTVVRFRTGVRAERGQVIAFEYPFPYPGRPRRELILRVIGVAGDLVELTPDGVVVNGQRLEEPYAKNQTELGTGRAMVPPDSYYLLGDDRNNQRDSRWWGLLPASKLLGVADPEP